MVTNDDHSALIKLGVCPLRYKCWKRTISVEKETYEGTACSWKLETPLVQLIEKKWLWVDEKKGTRQDVEMFKLKEKIVGKE